MCGYKWGRLKRFQTTYCQKGSINKPMFYDIMIIFLIHKLGNYFYGNFATYATYCCT
ncbi:hypothetical protein HMPREF1051_0153 [Neisseria sicca VK64]|uniref:Uncharacterized protein n=1 Tax=Neisseria sicca VK64 TaxID=1095748 RepID=I2NE07_NEISI|nr:hypothetical protein HMPREF1051_0153 [Neisseria sicca VK64]